MIAYKVVKRTNNPDVFTSLYIDQIKPEWVETYSVGKKTSKKRQRGPLFVCTTLGRAEYIIEQNEGLGEMTILECEVTLSHVPWKFFIFELFNLTYKEQVTEARKDPYNEPNEAFAKDVTPIREIKETE